MILALFITELILAVITIFTTYMLSNKFKAIEASLGIYNSSRAYKTVSQVAFIEKVLKKYTECIETIGEDINIETMIKAVLYKEYIGKFPFAAVKGIALKATHIMWGVIVLEGIVSFIIGTVHDVSTIVMVTISILMTIIIEMFKYIKSIEDQSDVIIMLVQDYIQNVYPVEVKKTLAYKEIAKLKTRIAELEREQKAEEPLGFTNNKSQIEEKKSHNVLSIHDIAKLIGIFE